MVGIRTFLRRTWGRVWIYSFFALLLMIALSFIQHVIGGINWEAFQYPAEDGKPNVFVDDINHPSELTSLLVGDNHLYLFYGRIDVVKVYDLDGQYLYSVNFRDGRDSGGPSYIYKLLNNLRTSAKNFLYAYANSAAMNGMNETSHVVHTSLGSRRTC